MQLADAVVVVTGGTGGLGNRICRAFARQRARIAIVYLNRTDAAERLAAEVCAEGAAAALAVKADVTDPDQVNRIVERVTAEWGRIDVLVNNAAFNQGVPFNDLQALIPDIWQKIMHANCTAPYLMARAVAPVMRARHAGRIINSGSVSGFKPVGSSIAYSVSKAALAHLTRCLALALAPDVLVNSVAPGLMDGTLITERMLPEQVQQSKDDSVLRRAVNKDDVAEQVVTFARSSSTTDQNVIIDAGRFFH
jgi:3-oxoacyl-[acyl-carrier protein] reductase